MKKKQNPALDKAIQVIAWDITEKNPQKNETGLTWEELFNNAVDSLRKMAEKDPAAAEQFIAGAQRIEMDRAKQLGQGLSSTVSRLNCEGQNVAAAKRGRTH